MPEWFTQLTEDSGDPHTPAFWETMAWASRQGMDLKPPPVQLPEPSLGVQIAELQRQVAIKTPTMLMEVAKENAKPTEVETLALERREDVVGRDRTQYNEGGWVSRNSRGGLNVSLDID